MGYCISSVDSDFYIPYESKAGALVVAKAMFNPGNEHRMQGGGGDTHWYSWMNLAEPDKWELLEDAFTAWSWPVDTDEEGNICAICFEGDKLGQEQLFFSAIAPFVASFSYIECQGEDGSRWRWSFEDGKCIEKYAKIIWE